MHKSDLGELHAPRAVRYGTVVVRAIALAREPRGSDERSPGGATTHHGRERGFPPAFKTRFVAQGPLTISSVAASRSFSSCSIDSWTLRT